MSTELLIGIIVAALLIALILPTWPYSQSWGYAPTGTLLVVVILIVIFWSIPNNGTSFHRSVGADLKSDVRAVGQDLKAVGRDAAEGIRDAVQ